MGDQTAAVWEGNVVSLWSVTPDTIGRERLRYEGMERIRKAAAQVKTHEVCNNLLVEEVLGPRV